MKISSIIFFVCILLSFFTTQTRSTSDLEFPSMSCPNTTDFAPNSTYESNLQHLLSSLSSNATNSPTGFHSVSVGIKAPELAPLRDVAYGIFLCRGDVSTDVCNDCVYTATQEALSRCPGSRDAAIWYEECMIRYSNEQFSGKVDFSDVQTQWSNSNVTDPRGLYEEVLGKTLNDIVTRAVVGDWSGKKFAVGKGDFSLIDTVYALAQCTPDLTRSDCDYCLRQCISTITGCCVQTPAAIVSYTSCNVRFDNFQFYNTPSAAPPPPPSPPSSPVSRPPMSPPPPRGEGNGKQLSKVVVPIVISIGASVLLFILAFCLLTRRRTILKIPDSVGAIYDGDNDITTEHPLRYDLGTIQAATNNFSLENKIGEGGYGSVYKGLLSNGKDIAVKRLSQSSAQGATEFKNEVGVVAKLQHRNLVRLRGFCLEGEEKILVYEFLPNKSLDYIIFDPKESVKLDWSTRYKIIGGIARGMLYLHEDSRLRIIHRDLKASNVLLDTDMNAKVSDFGMAKIFGGDQTHGSTSRVVGTLGYMSPEYAIHGHFSVKSDVFSFGVLLLEIVTGKKNGSSYNADRGNDLLSYAWRLWMEGNHLDLVDPVLEGSYARSEVTRCIHIGLLCVQEDADARPSTAIVVLMLNTSNSVNLSPPQEPPLFPRGRSSGSIPTTTTDSIQSAYQSTPASVNKVSITEILPR